MNSVTCGFFNSTEGDPRRYDAADFSKLFDGIILDGVFGSIDDKLYVTAQEGNTVHVGAGKCWFNHTWTRNSEPLPIECDPADAQFPRIDAIVLEVNSSDSVRDNCFKYIKGTAGTNPSRPSLIDTSFVHQHALCYITRPAGSTSISQSNIRNVIGTDETPFITSVLKAVSINELFSQWQDDLDTFCGDEKEKISYFIEQQEAIYDQSRLSKEKKFDEAIVAKEAAHDAWSAELRREMESLLTEAESWFTNTHTTVDNYLTRIKGKLETEAATNLQLQIDENEIKDILMNGFAGGTKGMSEDCTIITSTDSLGRKLVKTFTNNFATSTTVLTDEHNTELGRLVKNFSSDGLTITSEITLL